MGPRVATDGRFGMAILDAADELRLPLHRRAPRQSAQRVGLAGDTPGSHACAVTQINFIVEIIAPMAENHQHVRGLCQCERWT